MFWQVVPTKGDPTEENRCQMWALPLAFLGLSLLMEHLLSTPWNQRIVEVDAWKSFIQPHIFDRWNILPYVTIPVLSHQQFFLF